MTKTVEKQPVQKGAWSRVLHLITASRIPWLMVIVTALVGQSGAGKTTILGMLERFFVPNHGRITMDGQDIQTFALQAWRQNFAYITQEKICLPERSVRTWSMGSSGR